MIIRGGLRMLKNAHVGGGEVKNPQKHAHVINGWPQMGKATKCKSPFYCVTKIKGFWVVDFVDCAFQNDFCFCTAISIISTGLIMF